MRRSDRNRRGRPGGLQLEILLCPCQETTGQTVKEFARFFFTRPGCFLSLDGHIDLYCDDVPVDDFPVVIKERFSRQVLPVVHPVVPQHSCDDIDRFARRYARLPFAAHAVRFIWMDVIHPALADDFTKRSS